MAFQRSARTQPAPNERRWVTPIACSLAANERASVLLCGVGMSHLEDRFPRLASSRGAVVALVRLALPNSDQTSNWRVAPDLDDAELAINAGSGPLSPNDGAIVSDL